MHPSIYLDTIPRSSFSHEVNPNLKKKKKKGSNEPIQVLPKQTTTHQQQFKIHIGYSQPGKEAMLGGGESWIKNKTREAFGL